MSLVRQILRDPIVHFIVAGALIYGAYSLLRPPQSGGSDASTIIVDRQALLTFMQYRANAFEPETFGAALDAMNGPELDELVAAYVDEEMLYREALSLDLAASDYIIRQRMVQKVNFLLSDIAGQVSDVSEAELAEYFHSNRDAYAVQPWTTFTHVFVDAQRHREDAAVVAARLRDELNANGAGFTDAPGHGDRFAFLRNYVERTYEYVASHFGYEFASALAALPESESEWQGPISSTFGEHVVLVTRQVPRTLPQLEQVRTDVERDFATQRSAEALAAMLESLRDDYRIVIRDLQASRP